MTQGSSSLTGWDDDYCAVCVGSQESWDWHKSEEFNRTMQETRARLNEVKQETNRKVEELSGKFRRVELECQKLKSAQENVQQLLRRMALL